MMKIMIFLVANLFFVTMAHAEGAWNVNGYTLSNVNTLQHGNEVAVSGRVSSGKMKSPLQILVSVSDDEGRVYNALATVPRYTGQSELFETRFNTWKRAKWWKIVDIKTN